MILFYTVFLLVPIGIAFAGSFHEWNPLSGIYRFNGIENYVSVFTSALFGKSMLNTLIFSVVVIFFRVGLGLAIAIAIYSNLIKHKSFFRAIYYMPVVTPMVAVAFVWKFLYNPQIGAINQILGLDINWLMNPKTALLAIMIMTIWKDFGYAVVGRPLLPSQRCHGGGESGWRVFLADLQVFNTSAVEAHDAVCGDYVHHFLYPGVCTGVDLNGRRSGNSHLPLLLYYL